MPQRLIVLILVPTVAAVVLSGLRISGSVSDAETYGRVERMAELGQGITEFVQEFSAERDEAIEYIAAGRPAALQQPLEAQQRRTDALVAKVRALSGPIDGSYGTEAVRDATTVRSRVDGVKALRSLVVGTKVPAFIVLQKYTDSAQELINVLDGISQNVADDTLAESSRALGALARAKEAVSRQRALILIGARERRLDSQELNALTAARSQEDSELAAFRGSASLEQIQRFEDTVVGTRIDQARDLRQRVIQAAAATGGRLPLQLGTAGSAKVIRSSMTAMIDQMRAVEKYLADQIEAQSSQSGDDARTQAVINSVVVAILLLIVLLITIVMARSLVRPLRRLQSGALDVANARLPGLVDRLRDPEAAAGGIEVKPIEIDSTDEIGQVARAFDEVHREAVRLAADEAVLRGNINAMFVNLSRRSQSLIERQLRLIEELEQSERDEEQLGNLFRLDHLATRMRRNCENLLVLGGQEQVRRWNQPVPLIDVVRASLSEVEQYERVALRVQGDMTVVGPVVNDLVHLLAELVENATVFSSENTKVTVSGQMLSGGGCMLQITDNGVGMSPEELEQANWRLANPPVIDFSAARRMGLFVVGRLAVRHGIRVELRAAQGGGLTAFVVLPDAVVTPGESGGIGTRPGLAPREAGSHGQLAALTTTAAEPPAGGFRQDDYGPAPTMGGGTGPHSMTGGTGAHPMVGGTGPLRPIRGATGPQPSIAETGPIPAPGAHDPYGTGAQPAVPPAERRPPRDRRTPAHDPYGTGERQPPRRPGELPVREPGTHLQNRPSDGGSSNGLFQPRSERPQEVEDAGTNGAYRPGGRTGPQSVVPEAQPLVPEPGGARHIPWETGPLEQVGPNPGQAPAPYAEDVSPRSAPRVPEGPVPEPQAVRAAAAAQPEPKAPPRVPERSPIFDAMQSEWFMHRSGGASGEVPSKGWESPADAGFRAAEAAREPVATSRTGVGLPKRVPGKNRIPGAVGRGAQDAPQAPAGPPQGRPAPGGAGQGPQAPTQGLPVIGQQPQGQQAQGHGQSADDVRNRFASLQRGVHRGRHEARGTGTSGEVPSQGDGETGGTR
ncbi:sensor histidine kinase [Actinomadura mexicana]|uniref:histidine kinase n=1 Tax=Actinomadura mexicana TaxID=134959 RepID=A0A238ZX74_9ACTN|nr:nitrate- and nitrite sensing domain-containing protein [Actinomadura mexicana]SNR87601.1 Signal transduction histidine kinase [Actinomadura mexicana]